MKEEIKIENNYTCPECGEEQGLPTINPNACNCPTMISLSPGHHIHHTCPVHGRVKIGSPSVYC